MCLADTAYDCRISSDTGKAEAVDYSEEKQKGCNTYRRTNFYEAKEYLYQVRDCERRYELLRKRIDLRLNDPDGSEFPDTEEMEEELRNIREETSNAMIDVTDLAARLPEIDQQMVITKRYADLETWDQIADEMGCAVRTVQKLHGKALPVLDALVKQMGLRRGTGIADLK